MDKFYQQLAEDIGLELILEQNDLTQEQVLQFLFEKGLLDLEDYMFSELEVDD